MIDIPEVPVIILQYFAGVTFLIACHEGGHALLLRYYRILIKGIGLGLCLLGLSYRFIREPGQGRFYFKGWPHVDADEPEPGMALLMIAAAGPMGSFLCGLTTCYLFGVTRFMDPAYILHHPFQLACAIGVVTWASNLIDADVGGGPTDGRFIYRSIRALRNRR